MKAFIVAALIVGLAAAQSIVTQDYAASTCTSTNETGCANYTDACCGTITHKTGAAAAVTVTNKCLSRRLVEATPNTWWMSGTNNVTVSYACLNTTKPSGYVTYPACTDSANCSSGFCCANFNYTINLRTNVNITAAACVPGDFGRDAGTLVNFKHSASQADMNYTTVCYSSINSGFYSSAVLLKSAVALAVAGIVSLAL